MIAVRSSILLLAAVAAVGCTHWQPESARPILAVAPVIVSAQGVRGPAVRELTDQLRAALLATDRYLLLSDPDTQERLAEAMANQDGPEALRDAARLVSGSLYRARFGVSVELTEFGTQRFAKRFPPWQSGELGPDQAVASMLVRVENIETGHQVGSRAIHVRRRIGGDAAPTVHPFGSQPFARSPHGKAVEDAIAGVVDEIIAAVEPEDWTPMIAAVADDRIFVNGGRDRGIRVGDRFQIYRNKRELRDAQSGQLLGVDVAEPMGSVRVTEVGPRHAVCATPAGWALEPGMVMEPVAVEQPKRFLFF